MCLLSVLNMIWCCCSLLQLSTRPYVLEEKGSDQTPSLSSWRVRHRSHAEDTHMHAHTYLKMFSFSLWQTSMSARSCQAYARVDSASTPLAASSVNVQEDTLSTQKPESVKVLDLHMHELASDLVIFSSCLGIIHRKGN